MFIPQEPTFFVCLFLLLCFGREAYLKTLDSHLELDGNMSAFQLIELVKLFLCGVDLPREAVVSILGEDVTSELVYLNILFPYHTYEPFRLSSSDSDGVADDIESAPGEIVEEIACLRVKKNATSVLKEIPVDKASSTHGGCYFRSLVQLTPVAIYPVGCSGISNGASKSATGLFVTDFAQVQCPIFFLLYLDCFPPCLAQQQ